MQIRFTANIDANVQNAHKKHIHSLEVDKCFIQLEDMHIKRWKHVNQITNLFANPLVASTILYC